MTFFKSISMICLLLPLTLWTQSSLADKQKCILSLDLCTDWMLLRYAEPSRQITYSPLLYRYPQDWIPEGLPVHDGSLERILQIAPDLIISGEFNATLLVKRLQQLQQRVEVMPLPLNLQGIIDYSDRFKSLIKTNDLLDRPLQIPYFKPRGETLLLLGANGIGSGKETLEGDVIEKSGWDNYLQASGFVAVDLEQMVQRPPAAVLWSRPLANSLSNHFVEHRALRGIISEQDSALSQYWRWQCPGPWTFDLISELAAWKKH